MENDEYIDNPDSVFLNPTYASLSNANLNKEDWEQLLFSYRDKIPDWLKKHIEEQMDDPIKISDSRLFGMIKGYLENPERSKIYKDEILFKNPADFNHDELQAEWKVEVPLVSIDF